MEPCADLEILLAVAAALGALHVGTLGLLVVVLVRQRALRQAIATQTVLLAVCARGEDVTDERAGDELH